MDKSSGGSETLGAGNHRGHMIGSLRPRGKTELTLPPSHTRQATGQGHYLQLQVNVNLWPQQAEKVGCPGELKP